MSMFPSSGNQVPLTLLPIEELFSAWRWKVYEHHTLMTLLTAMDAAGDDITADAG